MIKDGIIQADNIYGVPFKVDLIPKSNKTSRPGTIINAISKTIHETANKRKGAGEDMHTEFVDNTSEEVSWTFTVGDEKIIQELPINEEQYHSGTKLGNTTSVSLELCVDEGSDWEKTKENAAKLCVFLELEAGIVDTRTHKSWSGKDCPHIILDEGWTKFVSLISRVKDDIEKYNVSDWAKEAHEFVVANGISTGERPKDLCSREEQWAMIYNYHKCLTESLGKLLNKKLEIN